MSNHPTPFQLEAWSVGEKSPIMEAHVATCPECQAYIDGLSQTKSTFLAKEKPEEVVRRLRQKVSEKEKPAFWVGLRWYLLSGATVIVLLFVGVLVWNKTFSGFGHTPRHEIRLKGSMQIAAIVLRQGQQTRHGGEVSVISGDRLRLELTLPSERTISVGIWEDPGKWTLLLEKTHLKPGIHYLEQALRIDQHPTAARIVVGDPQEVKHAIESQNWDKVETLRIIPEKQP